MRRARIKAMATVPARRKQAVKEEDLPNVVSKETVERGGDETIVTNTDNITQSANDTANLLTTKNDTTSKLQQPSNVPEMIDSPIVKPNNEQRVPEEISELSESIIKESSDTEVKKTETASEISENIITEKEDKQRQEDAPIPGSKETKTSASNDTSPVTKILQTRTSFMRPTPRLDGGGRIRRNSVQGSGASASESEDDCRRTTSGIAKRMRNDSVSSMQSKNNGPSRENSSTAGSVNVTGNNTASNAGGSTLGNRNSTKFCARQKRKVVVSESARKLAEARREFLLKHENKQPDRAKLTMYDLIYYNPVTNPMKKIEPSLAATQRTSSSVVRPVTDDEEEEECEAGEAMPVPQVKVGPDGHLIIDEQSLVIEHTGAKKNRQALARTEALVDEDNNGNGFYKKRAKTKDWPKWETLKFYKALNGVGTDFLLMQSLFPNRSRQEIKMKFKKEEKINRCLIEKALTYHQEFDIDSLKEDLATFDETENSKQFDPVKGGKSTTRQAGQLKRKKNKSRRMAALSIDELNEEVDDPDPSVEKTNDDSPSRVSVQESEPRRERKRGVQRRNAVAESRTRSESSSSNESASDTEIYQIKPTRSGRLPKVRKLQAPTINTLDNMFSDHEQDSKEPASPELPITETEHRNSSNSNDESEAATHETVSVEDLSTKTEIIHNPISGIAQVEPGSLVIVSRESTDDPGETVLQVYMVSSDIDDSSGVKQNMTPVVLTPELLNTVTAGITKVAPIDIKME